MPQPLCNPQCRSPYRLNKRQRGHRGCLNDGSSIRADFLYWESNQDLAAVQFVACWMHLQGYALYAYYCIPWLYSPRWPTPSHCWGFQTTLRHTKFGRTPLDYWSARRRNLYLKKPNNYTRETSLPRSEFEPAIATSERPQTHTLHRVATGIGT
jgi:hypothetical protein